MSVVSLLEGYVNVCGLSVLLPETMLVFEGLSCH